MIRIIKNASVYTPAYIGIKDVVIEGNKICKIGENLNIENNSALEIDIFDGIGKLLVPGFIDNHVHIIGGGGEGGYKTRIPEVKLTDITIGGVTTVIGCLGMDDISRSTETLLAKARGLEEEGITAYIYTGSYRVPVTTITGDVEKDIVIIDKIIGAGEIAISDHRSFQPTINEIRRLAAEARAGGILSGKAGIVNLHLGNGKRMLEMIIEILENTEIPYTQFLPTHMNRNPYLFNEAINYARAGGYVDFTTSYDPAYLEKGEVKASLALKICLDSGVPDNRITFSSDGQGSLPVFNEKKELIKYGVGKVASNFIEIKDAVLKDHIPLDIALKVLTSNPAEILKLKGKGRIKKGYDADIVLIDERDFEIDTVIAKGQFMIKNKEIEAFGTFEAQHNTK